MTPEALRFYFDFISHNAYLAWTQIHALAERQGRSVEPVPVLFAGLLAAHGQLGPAEIRPKAVWMLKDVVRKARRLGIPLEPPAGHPFNPLPALRACCLELDTATRRALIDALFRAAWAESRNLGDPEVVAEVAAGCGVKPADVRQQIVSDTVKTRLRHTTDRAVTDGIFGVPTMVVDGELFWGFDDFPHLEAFLTGDDLITADDLERWRAVRPLAWRSQAPPRTSGSS